MIGLAPAASNNEAASSRSLYNSCAAVATGVIGGVHLGLSAMNNDKEGGEVEQEMTSTTPEENKQLAQQFTNAIESDPEFEKLKQELAQ